MTPQLGDRPSPDPSGGCPDEDDLAGHLEGTLPAADRVAIESHCAACGHCRETLALAARAGRSMPGDSSTCVLPALQREIESTVWNVLRESAPADAIVGTRIGRFEITGVQGRGAFGIVYRARDTELGRMVALKLMQPPARSRRSPSEAMFLTEAAAAARLQHPNIVTLHDYGTFDHARYLVLELLDGETLRDRIERGAHLVTLDALSIAIDMTRALVAAHASGVIHRDIKPSNIFLCTSGQTKLLDLGLAVLQTRVENTQHPAEARATAAWAGTPHYMAPELFHGHPADECTDVYAMGVTLLEMLTGKDSSIPRSTVEDRVARASLSPRLRRLVRGATAPERMRRFQRAHELLVALTRTRSDLVRAPSGRLHLVLGALAVAATASAAGAYRSAERPRRGVPHAIAVLGFDDLSGRKETEWLAGALSEMLHTDLASSPALRVTSPDQVFHARTDLRLAERVPHDRAVLRGLGRYLGAEYLVSGSYVSVVSHDGSKIRIDVHVEDTAGQLIYAISETDAGSELLDLVARISSRLRVQLTGEVITTEEARSLRSSMPRTAQAVRLYTEGLRHARSGDPVGARVLLARAVAAEPDFPLAHSALAAVLHTLHEEPRMRQEAQAAFERSGGLRRDERLRVEARYREAVGDFATGLALRRELHDLDPEDLEDGLELAEALDSHVRREEAREVIAELRRLALPWRDDPRIDLVDASTQNDPVIRKALLLAAADKATALGTRWVLARARVREAYVERELGDLERSLAAAEDSRALCEAIGDREGLMIALFEIGTTQLLRGDPISAAVATYDQALGLARQLGDGVLVAQLLCDIAFLYLAAGNPAQAALRLDEVEQLSPDTALDQGTIEQIARSRAIQWRDTGDLDRALAQLEHVLRVFVAPHKVRALTVIGEVLMAQGQLDQARSRFEEFLASSPSRDSTWYVDAVLALSRLDLEDGQTVHAEAQVRECIAICARTHDDFDLATAHVVLAEALLAERRFDEARVAAEAALRLASRSEVMSDWIDARIALSLALFGLHPNDIDAALAQDKLALHQARTSGLVGRIYEARLAAAVIAEKAHRPHASDELRALAGDADEHGFGLIARKARAAP
ncbi:MAG TPA: protein kinase [Kofleriaceae bacterium]|jgi:serine/threonine protein kinase/tetratricopeptide (TPR) repeat protein|nr:protein kinase [Kofleriaceae bacterium]